jgi:hypothetical protein
MNTPLNPALYNDVKLMADIIYKKPSAYRSSWIVKTYKQRGGKYSGVKTTEGLTRWHAERWADVGGLDYPVYRPTKINNKNTPLTVAEIPAARLKQQIALKQKIRGSRNLPPF